KSQRHRGRFRLSCDHGTSRRLGDGYWLSWLSIGPGVSGAERPRHAPMSATKDPDLYRPNVGLALFHRTGLVFLGKRAGAEGPHQWQMPQGGVDKGETPAQAALRELEEEVGVSPDKVDLLEEGSDWLYYDFPTEVRAGMKARGRYLGQRQKWFALR